MKRIATLMILLIALALPAAAQEYADGIYRRFYYDGGIEQIAIQFELKDGKFDSLVYRGVKYKDGDYMSEDASDAQKAILHQYRQLADYLVGKGISAIDDLYSPYDIVEDLDAVTTATMKAGKLVSALWDGLNRHPYKIVDTTKLPEAEPYADGVYRGSYMRTAASRSRWNSPCRTTHSPSFTTRRCNIKTRIISRRTATRPPRSAASSTSCLSIWSARPFQA
ncbi:MAG: hypothetical protein ACLUI3_04330 [Christensenellales bacterium]